MNTITVVSVMAHLGQSEDGDEMADFPSDGRRQTREEGLYLQEPVVPEHERVRGGRDASSVRHEIIVDDSVLQVNRAGHRRGEAPSQLSNVIVV